MIAVGKYLAAFYIRNWNVRNEAFYQGCFPNLFLSREGASDLLVTFK